MVAVFEQDGVMTPDLRGDASTSDVGRAAARRIEAAET
jgi:hypothetical protein